MGGRSPFLVTHARNAQKRPTTPHCESHEGKDATQRGLGRHGARSCNGRRCCFAAVSDDRPGVGSNSSRCALFRTNRCVKGCDVLALFLLQSVLLPCPTHQMVRPGAILHRDLRFTTRFRRSGLLVGESAGCRAGYCVLCFPLREHPRFRIFVRTPAQSVAAETE